MVTCTVCGFENEPGALYCGSCGSALPGEANRTRGAVPAVPDDIVVPRKAGRDRSPGTEAGAESGAGTPRGAGTGPATGSPDASVPPSDAEPTIVCAACGTVNDMSRVYCRRCARELRPAVAAAPVAPVVARRPAIPPAAIAVIALAVVVLAGVGFVLFGGGGGGPGAGSSPSAAASATAAATPTDTASPTAGAEPSPTTPAVVEGDVPPGQIVYAAGGANIDLFMINADGTGSPERLTTAEGPDRDAAFSPDGSEIVYASATGIRILTIATGESRAVTSFRGDVNPFWSPVEDVLVFAGRRGNDTELEILRLVLGEDRVTPLTDNQVQDHDPVWSPDGTRIAWVLGADDSRELMLMDRDGGNVERLTNDDENDVDPAFSPTGDRLVFASKRGEGDDFDLFFFDLATREISQATDMAGDEHDPAWSPGGRYIAFHHGPVGQEDLFILDTLDGEITPLVQASGREILPAWR